MRLFAILVLMAACGGGKYTYDQGKSGSSGQDSGTTDTASTEDHDGDSFSPASGDCDDSNPDIYPSATEVACNGIDEDCDGSDLADSDRDGYDCEGQGGDDCDDSNPSVNPGATEIWYDGVDQDCDGGDDYDADSDGYESGEHGGDDCDDSNPSVNPASSETCYDGVDQNCDGIDDYDCDNDGYESADYGGDDCDDTDDTVYPGASEATPDGIDNDCDGDTDEDAYCNLYAPLANVSPASRTYNSLEYDGNTYTETVTISSWDASTGEATVHREFASSGSVVMTVDQDFICDSNGVSATELSLSYGSYGGISATYDRPRLDLLPDTELVPGATWNYEYTATEASFGPLWKAKGTYTVIGTDTITVSAGTFDVIELTNDYVVTDESGFGVFDRAGTVTLDLAEKVGLVYSQDVATDGSIQEIRELTSYTGFYP